MSYKVLLPEVMANVVLIAFMATLVAKLNEAVFGRLYTMLFKMFSVSEEAQERWRLTLFLWAIALGELLCIRAKIGFMTTILPTPDAYVLCGLMVGCGAGLIWDLVLDPVPDGVIPLSDDDLYEIVALGTIPTPEPYTIYPPRG